MIEIRRIDYGDPRAVVIRDVMDTEMFALYEGVEEGQTEETMASVEKALVVHPEAMVATVGAFDGETLVGHAALRPAVDAEGADALEVKRVIVLPSYRGQGVSKRLMAELEVIAAERGVNRLILQTGDRQIEAIALYVGIGYRPIPRFGLYEPVPFFLCYGKSL